MTTANKPLPPHGSTARASGSPGYRPPCKCEPCLLTRRREDKRRKYNKLAGRSPFVDPAAAQKHLQLLRRTMTLPSLAAATRTPESTLVAIEAGRRTKIHRDTHAKIMAVQQPKKADGGQYINVTGSRRRIQALAYIGHSMRTIATAANSGRMRIHTIAIGDQHTIRRDLAERIEAAYKHLVLRPASCDKFTARTRNLAKTRGWHGPLAWDDVTIDDPNAQPDTDEAPALTGFVQLGRYRRAEIQHLTDFGVPENEIAQRLGMRPQYVHDIIRELRKGRPAGATYEEAA